MDPTIVSEILKIALPEQFKQTDTSMAEMFARKMPQQNRAGHVGMRPKLKAGASATFFTPSLVNKFIFSGWKKYNF